MSDIEVSIITVVFNGEKTIRRTLESVRKIKNDNVEYIVVDGLSTDDTLHIIEEYRDVVDILISEKDNGMYDALNKGIKSAHGKWTMILAADDIILQDAIPRFLNSVNNDTEIWCGSTVSKGDNYFFIEHSSNDLSRLPYECVLKHPASLFRRTVFEKYGYYDDSFKCTGDGELFLRMYKQGAVFQIAPIPIVFFSWGGMSTDSNSDITIKERAMIYRKYNIKDEQEILKWIRRTTIIQHVKNRISNAFIKRVRLKIKKLFRLDKTVQVASLEEIQNMGLSIDEL